MFRPHLVWENPNTPKPSARAGSLSLVNSTVQKPLTDAYSIANWMEQEFDRRRQGMTSHGASIILPQIPTLGLLDQACGILLSKGFCCSEPARLEPKYPGDAPAVTVWLERH